MGDVYLGQVRVGDKVRVREDAYGAEAGKIHNGKVGRILAARGGLFIISYDDGSMSSVHHEPGRLETWE